MYSGSSQGESTPLYFKIFNPQNNAYNLSLYPYQPTKHEHNFALIKCVYNKIKLSIYRREPYLNSNYPTFTKGLYEVKKGQVAHN